MPRLVSFDIGLKTCSVSVEDYAFSSSSKLPILPPTSMRYLSTLEATPEMKAYVKGVGLCGRVVWLEKRELGNKKEFFTNVVFQRLYGWVKELHTYLQSADVILIEQQMRVNNIAIALMHHLHACLLMTYGEKRVMLYASKNKTRVLGAPLKALDEGKMKKVSKYDRKKWSTEQANALLTERKEDRWHSYIFKENKSKKDDLSDVLMQALSYVVTESIAGRFVATNMPKEEKTTGRKKREECTETAAGVVAVPSGVTSDTFTSVKRVKRV